MALSGGVITQYTQTIILFLKIYELKSPLFRNAVDEIGIEHAG